MRRPLEVLISGAGIAGLSLAYWLGQRGHRATVIERADGLRSGGHAVDIRGTALDVVRRMGLEGAVREARTRIMTLSTVRRDGRRAYDVSIRPLHEARGDREVEIMRDDLVRILFDAGALHADVVFGDRITAVSRGPSAVGVEFEHRPAQDFDVVVGADGHHSALRELVFGPEAAYTRPLGACLAIYTVDNVLGLRDQAVLYNESGRGIGTFTVRDNARTKVVLIFRSDRAGLEYSDWQGQRDLVRRRYSGMGWETARLIDLLDDSQDFYFDEMSQVVMPQWSLGRVALLGDAAFGPSPLSGQGTSLALIGAYLMAYQLDVVSDPLAAFGLWESSFRENVEANQQLAKDGLATLVPASRWGIAVRNQTVRLVPVIARLGRGFGGRIERASRAMVLPD